MSITLIEDLLKPNQYSYVSQRLTDSAIDWFYLPFTANPNDVAGQDPKYQGSFSHLIYKDNASISPLWDVSLLVLLAALDHQGQELDSVLRVRLGLCTRTPWSVEHSPHIDHPVLNHRTGIFYPVDSDGDTVVFDQRKEQASREQYTEWHRQRPTANLWMDFPGQHFHSSTTPVDHESRHVLTINYTVKEAKNR
jgi:hypothetical protein